jgi:DNA repair photolyase
MAGMLHDHARATPSLPGLIGEGAGASAKDGLGRIDPKYRPAWDGKSAEHQLAMSRYFLPHRSRKAALSPSRPRVVKWYCPFADQREFPSGHRYCINIYAGCGHRCEYCYAAAYAPTEPSAKTDFERMLRQDMADLERFDVPPAPVHLSNSTDPFQPLEARLGHARLGLEQVLEHRNRFTTVTVLTKNPLLPIRLGYTGLLRSLAELPTSHPRQDEFARTGRPGLCVEVSLAFWRDEARAAYEPSAPSVEDRIEGVRALRAAAVPVVLRIDPLFPRSPLRDDLPRSLADFGLTEAQMLDHLAALVRLAKEVGIAHVVYSSAKIVQPRARPLSATMCAMRKAYGFMASPGKLVVRGGAWRLPADVANSRIVAPFLEICRNEGVPASHCKHNLLETP